MTLKFEKTLKDEEREDVQRTRKELFSYSILLGLRAFAFQTVFSLYLQDKANSFILLLGEE